MSRVAQLYLIAPEPRSRPARAGSSEKGRRYPRDRACPKCFHLFTRKGIARHVPTCRQKKALTTPPGGA